MGIFKWQKRIVGKERRGRGREDEGRGSLGMNELILVLK